MFEFTDLRDQLAVYLTQKQVAQISDAYLLAEKSHRGQKRSNGEPYISHPLEVARILANMQMDPQSITAAILHDTIEDTDVSKADLEARFDADVANLVDGVTKLTQIKFESRAEAQAENFRKMILAMSKDIRVILIKLADRLHNMRTLHYLAPQKQKRIALETLEIYAPIAARLGMNSLRMELEDLGFCALYPMRYRVLKKAVRSARGNRKEIIGKIEDSIKGALKQAGLKNYTIWGREKHIYSLYNKMRRKGLSLVEVMDVYAFRIIFDTEDACYRALGHIHAAYKPVPGKFKDYIALPKANGYQSLHTVLLGPYGVPLEVQIRTEAMEQRAENGIASHWLYKTGEKNTAVEQHIQTQAWLKGLMDIQHHVGSSLEFIESVKLDLYPDEVYVFTPKGQIIALPKGSTPIDFAYLIHTDLGDTCVAAKIDRKLAPLSTRLSSGQTVEIVHAENAGPSPSWLNFVATGKARSNIRHWLKKQKIAESVALGQRLLSDVMPAERIFSEIDEAHLSEILKDLNVASVDNLYESIGMGTHLATLVAERFSALPDQKDEHQSTSLAIQGTEGMVVSYAKCCYPIPGDPIVGVISAGSGIVVHTESCSQGQRRQAQGRTCIHMHWANNVSGDFQVEIRIDVINTRGVLATISSIIADSGANIVGINLEEKESKQSVIDLILSVTDRKHLARIVRRLRCSSLVLRITREK